MGNCPTNLDTLPADERNRQLEPFFTGTLTFLYRMLFLFYAESRDLLPVRQERGYYEYSLERLKQRIANQTRANCMIAFPQTSTPIPRRTPRSL